MKRLKAIFTLVAMIAAVTWAKASPPDAAKEMVAKKVVYIVATPADDGAGYVNAWNDLVALPDVSNVNNADNMVAYSSKAWNDLANPPVMALNVNNELVSPAPDLLVATCPDEICSSADKDDADAVIPKAAVSKDVNTTGQKDALSLTDQEDCLPDIVVASENNNLKAEKDDTAADYPPLVAVKVE